MTISTLGIVSMSSKKQSRTAIVNISIIPTTSIKVGSQYNGYMNENEMCVIDYNNIIYRSLDYGTTWKDISSNLSRLSYNAWTCVASDGSMVFTGSNGNYGGYSLNDGDTWSTLGALTNNQAHPVNGQTPSFTDVVCSNDLSRVIFTTNSYGIFYSSNVTSTNTNIPATGTFTTPVSSYSLCTNINFDTFYVGGNNNQIFKGTIDIDGVPSLSVLSNSLSKVWRRICCSDDGNIVYAAADTGLIYRSIDAGTTWTSITTLSLSWKGLSCSFDGQILVACGNPGFIYTSIDGGNTLVKSTTTPLAWWYIGISKDGTTILATTKTRAYIGTLTIS